MSDRARRDPALRGGIRRICDTDVRVQGVRKVWRQMIGVGDAVARRTAARPMKETDLQGVVRGRTVRKTAADQAASCPRDLVNRQFRAPAPNPGLRLHRRRHVDGLRRRGVRDRRGRPPHRRPASVRDGPTRPSSSMPRSRRCVPAIPWPVTVSSVTATAAANVRGSATPSALPRPVWSHRSATSATATTTPRRDDQQPPQGRAESSTGLGDPSRRPCTPPSNGSTGSTTAGSRSRSETSRPPKPKRSGGPTRSRSPPDPNETASDQPGAVQRPASRPSCAIPTTGPTMGPGRGDMQ